MAVAHFGRLAKKYGAVIFFPTFTAATIYTDWSHTRAWKQQQQTLAKAEELLKKQQQLQ